MLPMLPEKKQTRETSLWWSIWWLVSPFLWKHCFFFPEFRWVNVETSLGVFRQWIGFVSPSGPEKSWMVSQGETLDEDYPNNMGSRFLLSRWNTGTIPMKCSWNFRYPDFLCGVFIVKKIRMVIFRFLNLPFCYMFIQIAPIQVSFVSVFFSNNHHTEIAGFSESKARLVHPFMYCI